MALRTPETAPLTLQRAAVQQALGNFAHLSEVSTTWGETHPALVAAWNALHDAETALTEAIENPVREVVAGSTEDLVSRNID